LHLTSAHSVTDTRIFVKEATSLAEAGFRVAVAGPGDVNCQQTINQVSVFSIERPGGRFARFSSFALKLYRFCTRMNPRVVHIHDPDLLLLSWWLKRRGIKIVYDVHEDFPKAVLSRTWLGPAIARRGTAKLVEMLEQSAASWLDGIVLADSQLANRFPLDRSIVARNYLSVSEWPTKFLAPKEELSSLKCIYVGDISEARGLTRMCDAIQEAHEAGIPATLELVGHINDSQIHSISKHPANRHIKLHGWGTRSEVAEKLASSDIAFCLLEPTPAYREALPVKVLEYIASGLIVIATDLPRLRRETLLKEAIHFVPWEAESGSLGAAIATVASSSSARKEHLKNVIIGHFNWSSEATRLVEFYFSVLLNPQERQPSFS
jgi:hypothetical protein